MLSGLHVKGLRLSCLFLSARSWYMPPSNGSFKKVKCALVVKSERDGELMRLTLESLDQNRWEGLHWFSRAATTKYHSKAGLQNKHVFPHSSGDWKSKVRVTGKAGFWWGLSPWLPDVSCRVLSSWLLSVSSGGLFSMRTHARSLLIGTESYSEPQFNDLI